MDTCFETASSGFEGFAEELCARAMGVYLARIRKPSCDARMNPTLAILMRKGPAHAPVYCKSDPYFEVMHTDEQMSQNLNS